MTRARVLVAAIMGAAAVGACGSDGPGPARDASRPTERPQGTPAGPDDSRPAVRPYEPPPEDAYRNGRKLAAEIAQDAATYRRGATAMEVARSLPRGSGTRSALATVIAPLVRKGHRSGGRVLYVQLSGVTATSLGAMVVVRQELEDEEGRPRSVTRTFDVRLRRENGPWRFDLIGSIGGKPVGRPSGLSADAQRVVDHRRIRLPDSAKWDIYRGGVDPELLRALLRAAEDHRIAVAVLSSGHPPNVWATSRLSAHTRGYAADIYAVDGRLVSEQRAADTPAYQLARSFLDNGARQVGSPWVLPPGAPRSFTDAVHQDHIHVQQTAAPPA